MVPSTRVAQRPRNARSSEQAFNARSAAMLQCASVTSGAVTEACQKPANALRFVRARHGCLAFNAGYGLASMRRFAPCAQRPRGVTGALPGSRVEPGACSALKHREPEPLLATRTHTGPGGGSDPYSGVQFVYVEVLDLPGGPNYVHGGPDSLVKSLSISSPWTCGSTGPTHKAGTDPEAYG
jgi:hypothetical protein